MKVHIWTEQVAPQIDFLEDGKIEFYDYYRIWGLRIGDKIKLLIDDELIDYQVTEIKAAEVEGYPEELREVTAQKVELLAKSEV